MNLRPIHKGIYCLDAEYVQPGVAAIYLLEQQGQLCIIETGTSLSLPLVEQAIASMGLSLDDVAYIIPTHIHLDHAGGAGALMQACPQAQLIIHPRGAAHMVDPNRLIAGTIAVYGEENYQRLYGEVVAVDEKRLVIAGDGFSLDFNGRKLDFVDTPGHALHHFCVIDSMSRGVFTGDTFGIAYPQLATQKGPFIFATTTPTHFDPDALLDSINRVLEADLDWLYLTHFGAVRITPRLIKQLKQSVRDLADMALALKNQPVDRVQKLTRGVMRLFVESLRADGGMQTEDEYHQQLSADSQLNAQGLQAWLNRLEKTARSSQT